MKQRTGFALAAALFMAPLAGQLLIAQAAPQPAQQPAQQPTQPARPPSVQVGVPEGRQGGQGRGGRQGGGQTTGGVTGPRAGGPAKPAPRGQDGRALLGGSNPKEKGVWIGGGGVARRDDIPYQAWAKAVSADRAVQQLEPHTRCKASGLMRQFLTPYGVEIVELRDAARIYMFDIGGPHTFRTIYTDGRSHPKNLTPSYYGHSIGWWEGDTLVVDSIGFNEGFWIDRGVAPHTEALHTVEKLTRTDFNTIKYELTVDDPGAYTRPWGGTMNLRWENGTELFEYVCQQQNYAHELMVGQYEHVDRTTLPVP
jgi:hypothetical protein